jgi:hypothetical protein
LKHTNWITKTHLYNYVSVLLSITIERFDGVNASNTPSSTIVAKSMRLGVGLLVDQSGTGARLNLALC